MQTCELLSPFGLCKRLSKAQSLQGSEVPQQETLQCYEPDAQDFGRASDFNLYKAISDSGLLAEFLASADVDWVLAQTVAEAQHLARQYSAKEYSVYLPQRLVPRQMAHQKD
jgi:hypothetical protein